MKIAFLISAHTDPSHLSALVKALPENSDFYVHVDAKVELAPFERLLRQPNVHFVKRRFDVVWGSWVEAAYQMELVRAALESGVAYDRLATLSGLDYPLWSNKKMLAFFERHPDVEYIQGVCMEGQGAAARLYEDYRIWNGCPWKKGSLKSKLRVALRRLIRLSGIRKPLSFSVRGKRYALYKGAAWWAVTPRLAARFLAAWSDVAFRNYFMTSFCSAETFAQTVAFNSEMASRCLLAKGKYESLTALTPLTYIDYDPEIKILTADDFDALMRSGKMFCRKTVSGKSDALLAMIDKSRSEP